MKIYSESKGFTLIELMITIAVAGILITVAVPSFQSFVKKNRLDTQQNLLYGSINLARSEAVSRGRNVSLCGSNNATGCTGHWGEGWLIYVGQGQATPNDDDILRKFEGLTGGNTLIFDNDELSFTSRGFAVATGSFALCDANPTIDSDRRQISIANTGRPALSSGVSIPCE